MRSDVRGLFGLILASTFVTVVALAVLATAGLGLISRGIAAGLTLAVLVVGGLVLGTIFAPAFRPRIRSRRPNSRFD